MTTYTSSCNVAHSTWNCLIHKQMTVNLYVAIDFASVHC
jgi:hypothetical protein